MRDTNRTLQLKLRDIEVVNDDYEQQARHTTSSLEDVESKYNVSIEKGVMLEEEIRAGEQEREGLRIETQRLRDELSDLRIESEITMEKLRHAETTIDRSTSRRPLPLHVNPARPLSQMSQTSMTTPPSPTTSTPPPGKSEASNSVAHTPPSPPLSDVPLAAMVGPKPRVSSTRRSLLLDSKATPRASSAAMTKPRHSRGPSVTSASISTTNGSQRMGPPPPRPRQSLSEALPRSGSLYQIKGLIGRMQKIEERVQSVRSKLPPASANSPKASPRAGSALDGHVPASVTLRSSRKRSSRSSTAGSAKQDEAATESCIVADPVKRLSFGRQTADLSERPTSSMSRPSSSASNASYTGDNPFVRPASRTSVGGARTSHGLYPPTPIAADRRPRSSMSGTHGTTKRGHKHSASVSNTRTSSVMPSTPLTVRRTTMDRTNIPTPSSALPVRHTGGVATTNTAGRRTSQAVKPVNNDRSMTPSAGHARNRSAVGETF